MLVEKNESENGNELFPVFMTVVIWGTLDVVSATHIQIGCIDVVVTGRFHSSTV